MKKLLLIILSFTPLIVTNFLPYPYISGKVIFIRSIVFVVLILFTIGLLKPDFRQQVSIKLNNLLRDKLFLAVLVYYIFFILSTVFAYDKQIAFAGYPERGEGFVGMFFFGLMFVLLLFLFEKKDYLWFFKGSLIAGFILLIQQVSDIGKGVISPSSLIGNREFFATYFLFVIFCAILVWQESWQSSKRIWLWISGLMVPLSILAIFLIEKKGVIASLGVGILVFLIYLTFHFIHEHSESLFHKRFKVLLISLLFLIVIFGGVFLATRKNKFWSKIPGLRNVASVSITNITIPTRIISAKISINAVNPINNGIKRFLFGWGWDNYYLAWYKYYNPQFYTYENGSFDRSHDKLLDVLTMNGFLGLLAYLSIWIIFFWRIFTRKKDYIMSSSLIFFGVSSFVQNLFVFDQLTTYIPFFVMLAFLISEDLQVSSEPQQSHLKLVFGSWLISICSAAFLILLTILPMIQMKRFLYLASDKQNRAEILNNNFVFSRYLYGDRFIRQQFMYTMIRSDFTEEKPLALLDLAIAKMDEGLELSNGKFYPDYSVDLGTGYDKKAVITKDKTFFSKGEDYFRKAIAISPMRQPLYIDYANNLFLQGRKEESEDQVRKALSLNEQSWNSHFYLGVFLMLRTNKYDEAMNQFEISFNSPYLLFNDEAQGAIFKVLERLYYNKDKNRYLQIIEWLYDFEPPSGLSTLYQNTINYIKINNELPPKFEF